jgi:peroxisomal membrane protein 4
MSAALLQAILDNPRYHDYLAILKGARNGLVYGFKVRFPHALIMAILFGRGEYVFPIHNTPATATSLSTPPTPPIPMRG